MHLCAGNLITRPLFVYVTTASLIPHPAPTMELVSNPWRTNDV